MLKYWIKWECPTENFWFSEGVTEKELIDRLNDPTIRILELVEFIDDDED